MVQHKPKDGILNLLAHTHLYCFKINICYNCCLLKEMTIFSLFVCFFLAVFELTAFTHVVLMRDVILAGSVNFVIAVVDIFRDVDVNVVVDDVLMLCG